MFSLPEQGGGAAEGERAGKGVPKCQQPEHLQEQSSLGEARRENLTKQSEFATPGRLGGSRWTVLGDEGGGG